LAVLRKEVKDITEKLRKQGREIKMELTRKRHKAKRGGRTNTTPTVFLPHHCARQPIIFACVC
jgi:hypothetical protein